MKSGRSRLASLAWRTGGRWRSLPRLALAALCGLLALQFLTPLLQVQGEVRDARSGAPVPDAIATAASNASRTGPDGRYALGLVPPWAGVQVVAEGYEPRGTPAWPVWPNVVALPPLSAELRVLDEDTDQPVAASVQADFGRVEPIEAWRFSVAPIKPGSRLTLQAEGYLPHTVVYESGPVLEARISPVRLGQILDRVTGQPVARALVLVNEQFLETDAEGRFSLPGRPKRPLRIMAPGYRKLEVDVRQHGSLNLQLEPFTVRGVYLTLYGVGDQGLRGNALRLLETTEANTIVVDVKGDRGLLTYESRVPLAQKIGANASPTLPDMDRFLADLHRRGHYAIARIVVFKDDLLAHNGGEAGLDLAIRDRLSGQVWVDGEGLGWVDPFRREVWDYNLALAREAAERGFDEVQFDYIRFPTDPRVGGSTDTAFYSREATAETRVEAIAGFLREARQALRPYGVYTSIDTFGYSCWRDDDLGIGQQLAVLAPHVDYISPMVYPSTFHAGLPGSIGYPAVIGRPYEVVLGSLQAASSRTGQSGAVLRPWLQYFDDYPWATARAYNGVEIEAQKRAAEQAGALGWMFWDPTNRYARGGFSPARGPAASPR